MDQSLLENYGLVLQSLLSSIRELIPLLYMYNANGKYYIVSECYSLLDYKNTVIPMRNITF